MVVALVVDDSGTDRRLAGRLLEKNSEWQVIYASDGKDALEQVELHVPDLVLTDLQMPEMNGLELVSAMQDEYPLIPVVLMTAEGSEEIAVEALQTGAASYVPKNVLAENLIETLESVFAATRQERNHSRLMHRISRNDIGFVLENDLSLFPSVISFLQRTIVSLRFCSESNRLRIGVALEEALLNAYYHGNLEVSSDLRETSHSAYYGLAQQRSAEEPYNQRRIFIDSSIGPSEVIYTIRDEGPGFDPSCLPDATDPANLERPCGRGLLLMRTFMDDVRFNESGNEVTMIKRRNPNSTTADDEEPS
jgi:CheY-like chemotaxis protein